MKTRRTWTGSVFIATSVDGYIALPDGGLDWLTDPPPETGHAPAHRGQDAPAGYDDSTADVTHLVMGRGTYDKVITFDQWPYDRFRTIVLSTTLAPDADSRVTVVASLEQAVNLLDDEQAARSTSTAGRSSPRSWPPD